MLKNITAAAEQAERAGDADEVTARLADLAVVLI